MLTKHSKPIPKSRIVEILSYTKFPHIVEIGCNDGADTMELLEAFDAVENFRIDCFEPDPRARAEFKALHPFVKSNGFLFPYALSDTIGECTFFQSSGTCEKAYKADWNLSGSLNKPTGHLIEHDWVKFETEITVKTKTLDWFWSNFCSRQIDFIWMDVQGAERKVLDGGRLALKNTRYLYLEFNEKKISLYDGDMNYEETVAALGGGWEPLAIYEDSNLLAVNHGCKI